MAVPCGQPGWVHGARFPLSRGVCAGESLPLAFGSRGGSSTGVHGRCCVPAGCQLNTGTRSCVVKEEDDDFLEHLVLLRTVRPEACQRAWLCPSSGAG